jgi:formylglycine-generating enzyme required for sulfatase activity
MIATDLIKTIQIPGLGIEMGIYPVTQAQYKEVMGENPSYFDGWSLIKDHFHQHHPVEQVTWDDAVEFCKKLSKMTDKTYRLPTEDEWEFACRAGTTTKFYFGDELSPDQANYGEYYDGTTRVGLFSPNAFGLYDMHGNVWEWCHGNGFRKPIRGGSWLNDPWHCVSAYRYNSNPGNRYSDIGFRVVCE